MTTQETIALAATIWDEAKKLEHAYKYEGGFATHSARCQTLYLKLCEQGTPGYQLHDVRVASAALKVIDALEQTDVSRIRIPGVLALALLNLEHEVRPNGKGVETRLADTLAKKCDELEAENKRLESENHNLKGEICHMKVMR